MWNERYSASEYVYGTEPNTFLVEQIEKLGEWPGARTLELAGGEGRNGVWLAQQGFAVTIVDGSEVGLAKARGLAESRGVAVETIHADLGAFEIEPESWDLVVSIWAHLPSAIRARLHAAVVAGLRPGGVFLLEAYTPAQLAYGTGGPRDVDLLMTRAALEGELMGLELISARELEREVQEGGHHSGHSAVVQVLARKPATGP